MKFVMALGLIFFGLNAIAENAILKGALNDICKKALINLGNGNYKSIHTVFSQGKHISAVSNYGMENDTNMLVFIDNKSGKSLLNVYLEDYRVADIKIEDNAVWAVANKRTAIDSRIYKIEFDKTQIMGIEYFPTHNYSGELGKYDKAYGLDTDNKYVYIAHGGLGLVSFSKEFLKPTELTALGLNPNSSHRSYITDVLVYEDKIIYGADNITYDFSNKTRAFEGYAIVDRSTKKILKKIPINQKREALFEPKLFLNASDIVMKTMHLHFVNNLDSLLKAKTFTPEKRIYQYSKGKPMGESFTAKNQIIGCFKDDKTLPAKSFSHSHKL